MTTVTKQGFGFWKKTIVEHNGKVDVYKGNAEIEQHDGSICITERGIFSENSTCYLQPVEKAYANADLLPDGVLVGKSKSIVVETSNGDQKTFSSGVFAINSMEKRGDKVHVIENGLFGKKTIDVLDATSIQKIASADCNVCKATNPLYHD